MSSIFAQDLNTTNYNKIRRTAKKLVRKKKVPGIAISIIKNDSLVFSEGFGYSDIESKSEIEPDKTIFRVGSVSKPISAVGLAKLVEAKKIDLESSIYDYLPNFPKKEYDFSLRQLGSHLAGIRGYKGNEFMNTKPLTIEQGIEIFKNDSLIFTPGTDYFYTSYGWNLLSLVMEQVVDKPFEDYIKDTILLPAGMNMTFADKNEYIPNKAKFYKKRRFRRFKEVEQVHNYFKLASGGYLSTSEDIALFGKQLLNGKLVNEAILETFTTSQEVKNNKTYYGIGFQASYDKSGRAYYGHVGNGLGGYAIFYVYPKEQVVISMLMNCSNPNQDKYFDRIIDEVFR